MIYKIDLNPRVRSKISSVTEIHASNFQPKKKLRQNHEEKGDRLEQSDSSSWWCGSGQDTKILGVVIGKVSNGAALDVWLQTSRVVQAPGGPEKSDLLLRQVCKMV